jgi:hypothetical protein
LTASVQTFFGAKGIWELPLSDMPMPGSLSSALRKLGAKTLGDLRSISRKDLRRVSGGNRGPVVGLRELIRRVRRGAVPIFIPERARGQLISTFPLSTRLGNALSANNIQLLGNLHGMSYGEISRLRNCGKKSVAELLDLVRTVQRAHPDRLFDARRRPAPFNPLVGERLFVPANVQDLKFADLPISVPLEGVLKQKKFTRLGDLHGASIKELMRFGNCGPATIAEISRLIAEAAAGVFKTVTVTETAVEWSPTDFVKFLDTLLGQLHGHEADVFRSWPAGESEPATLDEVGAQFKVSRERIRQIVDKTRHQLRKAGGRKLDAYLRRLARVCRELGRPLTPALLEQWLGERVSEFQFSPAFYARLLCKLSPALTQCQFAKDLISKTLSQAGRPMAGLELVEQLQQATSLSRRSIWVYLYRHREVRRYYSGYYGLKSWNLKE